MITFLVLALACGTSMHVADRTVPCASAVQSPKRGLAVQGNDYPSGITLNQADVDALSPGVLWYYNWAASTTVRDAQQRMAFVPMAWGRNGDNTNVQTWLNAHPGTPVVLLANEPNLAEQANLSVADAASFIQGTCAIAGSRPVDGAHLAASATTTAYRNALFDELVELGGIMPATCIHIYDPSTGGFGYWASDWPHEDWNAGQTPPSTVWVKEFNHGNQTAIESTVIDVMI